MANDAFRWELTGGAVMLSPGIIDLSGRNQRTILDAVRKHHDFGDDDPDDDHSVGDVEVTCAEAEPSLQLIFFRIDDVPGPTGTSRVLTVMLAEEWWKAGPPVVAPDGYDDEPVITEVEDCLSAGWPPLCQSLLALARLPNFVSPHKFAHGRLDFPPSVLNQ